MKIAAAGSLVVGLKRIDRFDPKLNVAAGVDLGPRAGKAFQMLAIDRMKSERVAIGGVVDDLEASPDQLERHGGVLLYQGIEPCVDPPVHH
jgi:hypothetical protein